MQFLELTYLHSLSQSGSNSGLQKRVGNALGAELEQLFSRDSLALKAGGEGEESGETARRGGEPRASPSLPSCSKKMLPALAIID